MTGWRARLFEALLYCYPPSFRRSHGDEMRQFARTAWLRGVPGPAWLLRDTLTGAVREWAAAARLPREPMGNLLKDIRHGIRLLVRTPAFTAAAVLTLALAIGANTAMFTLADATLLRPLQVHKPHELVVWSWSSSHPHYREYAKRTDIFKGVLAVGGTSRFNFSVDGSSELANGLYLSGNAFDVLGVGVAAGRPLQPSDDIGNAPVVGVLNHEYWRSRFGADPSVVGRTMRLNGLPLQIVGIAEQGFRGTTLSMAPALYLPNAVSARFRSGFMARVDPLTASGFVWLTVIGRLRDDVSAATAAAAMDAHYSQLQPPAKGERVEKLVLLPFETRALGSKASDVRRFVLLLWGVVGATLLIGCANLANLLLARAAARRREIGVRLAIGAGRARVVQQLLVESLLIALAGGAAGLAVASITLRALSTYQLPGGLPIENIPLAIDAAALAATFALSLATGLLFGVLPAWRASRTDILQSLREETQAVTARSSLRSVLLAAQVALSLVLIVGSGLFARSLLAAVNVPLGFNPKGLATASVNLGLASYDAPRARGFYETALAGVSALPEVTAAAWGDIIPTRGLFMGGTEVEGYTPAPGEEVTVYGWRVGPGFFDALGTRVIAGRRFGDADRAGAPLVGIVSEAMAKKYWPDGRAIGGRFKMFREWITVVGIVETSIVRELRETPASQVYLAFDQWLDGERGIATDPAHLFVRTSGDAAAILPALRERLHAIDRQVPLYNLRTFDEHVAPLSMPQRMGVTLFTLFSTLALALAAVGIYGVSTYVASQRTREIGIRMALGATRRAVTRLVVSYGATPIAVGLAMGLITAFYASRLLKAFLIDVEPTDPVTFAAVTLFLTLVALTASYLPARRVARVDPVAALRVE